MRKPSGKEHRVSSQWMLSFLLSVSARQKRKARQSQPYDLNQDLNSDLESATSLAP